MFASLEVANLAWAGSYLPFGHARKTPTHLPALPISMQVSRDPDRSGGARAHVESE
jgi:hypothetical protein